MTRPVVFLYRPDGRIDYAEMRNVATRGTKSSRAIAADKARAEAVAAACALRVKVQAGFRAPAGKLWGIDAGALLLIGPAGAIGVTSLMARTLAPLAVGGRHDEAVIAAVAGCRDVSALREQLAGIAPRLAAIGLRVDRRRVGIRITKVRSMPTAP